MNFEDWMQTSRSYIHLYPQRQRVPLLLHALPQELFLSAIKAGVTPDSDIDYCCEILSQLAIDQSERSLAREFFHRDQKVGENDEDYARSLQILADRAFRGCPSARVTSWAAAQFCAGVQPPTIAARLNAMKTNDLKQLVKAAIKMRQELPLTSASQTAHRRSNPPRPRWIPSRQTPRAGEAYYLLSCQPPNASRPFLQALGKLEGYSCRFLLDSGAVKSIVNPKAFPDLFRKVRARPSSIKLLSAEGRKMKAIGETSLKVTMGKESWTVQFIMCTELVWDVILGVDFLRKTGAILNFAEGTFTAQHHKTIKSVEPSPRKDADEICSALFEAAGIPVNNLDELCSQLTHHRQRKEGTALIAARILQNVRLARNQTRSDEHH
ncbi:Retroviral-like aspartic protease 1 [Taenia solium]|eukprot:TsM_000960800 transcript=TsM_000960800 gene=TsM_000960800